jgi:NADH dehydrogenase FAD-containing subunit
MSDKARVLILGGGFGGLYVALEFEKRTDPRFEVVFFSKDFVQYLDQRALATSQTETGAAPWNRDQLSDPSKSNNRIAA